ncbi:hypothetical protein LOTGIDRAFT_163781 [Lottia gigantea]|uniref:Uncharacterized protein n=1 Tax=Lottia gigantea TaxID=225164 RepID=V3ZI11_LOTGI|nr:hypothetical protein LOTGIDRAFT_163781 [Lottia gigantea]ESO90893.1 hypothetical protein LOTGIDRAFT_163781 [Lottia gigantea]
MGDKPEVEGQQTTSDSTIAQAGSQPSEEPLSDLRRRKRIYWLGRVSSGSSHIASHPFANLQQAQNAHEESSNGNSGISLHNGNGNSSVQQPSNFSQIDRDLHLQLSKVSINKFNGNKREYQMTQMVQGGFQEQEPNRHGIKITRLPASVLRRAEIIRAMFPEEYLSLPPQSESFIGFHTNHM